MTSATCYSPTLLVKELEKLARLLELKNALVPSAFTLLTQNTVFPLV